MSVNWTRKSWKLSLAYLYNRKRQKKYLEIVFCFEIANFKVEEHELKRFVVETHDSLSCFFLLIRCNRKSNWDITKISFYHARTHVANLIKRSDEWPKSRIIIIIIIIVFAAIIAIGGV